ncbi:MAG: PspC domain-containing protein [Flavobacterium sp.]|nr:PspC domain-containing protein [Pedobacter sp.]
MEKKLQRNEQDKIIAGVCSGLAEYFDVDVTWIRIAFVVAVLAGFSGILAYIILWIAVPAKAFVPENYSAYGKYNADYRVYDNKAPNSYSVSEPPQNLKKSGNGRMIVGLIMVGFGAFFLLDEFNVIPYWFDFDKLWPLIFIIPGILIISKNGKPNKSADAAQVQETEISSADQAERGITVEESK